MARAATTSDSFNAVAEPRRREILNYLAFQERAVGDIVVGLKMDQPSVSKHLRVLRNVGLVRVRRNGGMCSIGRMRKPSGRCMSGLKPLKHYGSTLIRGKERADAKQKFLESN